MDPGKYVTDDDNIQCKLMYTILEMCEKNVTDNIFSGKCMHVNCGPGNTTMSLLLPALHPYAKLTGIDIDKDMIEFAKKNYHTDKRLTFEVMDIQTKRLPDEYVCKYNHIFSFNTLQWCTDILQAFVNIYRMLKPGGSTVFYFEVKSDVPLILETLVTDDRFAPYSQELKNVYLYGKEQEPWVINALEIEEFLANIGFMILHYDQHNVEYYEFQDFESLLATTIASMNPLLHKLPVHLRANFRNQFASKFRRKYVSRKKNNLKTHIKNTLVIVHASRGPKPRKLLNSNEILMSTSTFDINLSLDEVRQININKIIKTYKNVFSFMTDKCMNIGCGLGNVTELLLSVLHPHATMIGVDTSKSIIQCARQLCKNKKVTFEVFNIETTVLPESYVSQFGHIFSFYALQRCKNIRHAFLNIYRMLRLGGMAVLWFKTESDIPEIIETLRNDERFKNDFTMDKKKLLSYDSEFSLKRDTKNVLESIGFYIRHYSLKTEHVSSKDFDEYLNFFITETLIPMISNMPPTKQKEFKKLFRDEIIKRSIDPLLRKTIRDLYQKNVCTGDTTILVFAEKTRRKRVKVQ